MPLLHGVALVDIPGISHPAAYRALHSLSEAREVNDGVALLSTFGTTRLYVVCPASTIVCGDGPLQRAAVDIAARTGGGDPGGQPGVRYCRIPKGERIWNMHVGGERHTRLGDDPWIADELGGLRPAIVDLLAGRIERLARSGA